MTYQIKRKKVLEKIEFVTQWIHENGTDNNRYDSRIRPI